MPVFAVPLRDNVYLPPYEWPSPPFTKSRKYLKSPEDLGSSGAGRTKRTAFFVEQVERMLAGGQEFAPFCFIDQNGTTRCMDKACLKYVGPEGQRLFEYVLDNRGLVVGLRRPNDLLDDVTQMLQDRIGSETERAQLILARVGQGKFRDEVLANWNGSCALTGSSVVQALRASHIVPWRDANRQERLDPSNGIPLLATIDALFDTGLISFTSDGTMLIKPEYVSAIASLALPSKLRAAPSRKTQTYLQRHRRAFGFSP